MPDRFFIPTPIEGDFVAATGPEAHHLAHVLRARPGDRAVLFDGSGAEFLAQIDAVGKREVSFTIVRREVPSQDAERPLTLAVALPKGERQKWLVEKLTELGVACLVPLVVERGVAQPVESAIERLRRTVIEACKQCGRNRLMQIASPQTIGQLVQAQAVGQGLIAHPHGAALADVVAEKHGEQADSPLVVAIGPEGGFTDDEVAQAVAAGWRRVGLGPLILRIETAALAAAAFIMQQSRRGSETAGEGRHELNA